MDVMEILKDLISSVGFPIACCVVMFIQNSQFQKTLNEISVTMTLMVDKIKDIEEKLEDK